MTIKFTDRNFIPAIAVFALPWISDVIIFAGTSEAGQMLGASKSILQMAIYTAAPFFLVALAMRPRPRVSRALWFGATLTAMLWLAFALTGRINDVNTDIEGGTSFLWLFIILMIWPCVVTILIGIAAKWKELPFKGHIHDQAR